MDAPLEAPPEAPPTEPQEPSADADPDALLADELREAIRRKLAPAAER